MLWLSIFFWNFTYSSQPVKRYLEATIRQDLAKKMEDLSFVVFDIFLSLFTNKNLVNAGRGNFHIHILYVQYKSPLSCPPPPTTPSACVVLKCICVAGTLVEKT